MMMRLLAVAGNSCFLFVKSALDNLLVSGSEINKAAFLRVYQLPKKTTHCASHSLSWKAQLIVKSTEGGENGVGNCATQVRNSMVSNSNT